MQFGVAPTFRIGVPGGDVVVNEQGDTRRSIGIYGSTITLLPGWKKWPKPTAPFREMSPRRYLSLRPGCIRSDTRKLRAYPPRSRSSSIGTVERQPRRRSKRSGGCAPCCAGARLPASKRLTKRETESALARRSQSMRRCLSRGRCTCLRPGHRRSPRFGAVRAGCRSATV
jgi:hypothetical protein